MSSTPPLPLIDAARYSALEERFAALLGAPSLFLYQGEAMISLEAVARGVGRRSARALNIVTGPYGDGFGAWLSQEGVEVETLRVPFSRAVTVEEVREALAKSHFDIVSVVHTEAATGITNPLEEIATLARGAGALSVVDAVASIGAEQLSIEDWGLDFTVVSAQKALGGPAGVTGVAISERGWAALEANPTAPRDSVLSFLDWRDQWLRSDHTSLPSIPNHLETLAFESTLRDVAAEGLGHVISRHTASRDACRRGVRGLGLSLWVESDVEAAAVCTTVAAPDGVSVEDLVAASRHALGGGLSPALTAAPGPLSLEALRVSHTGARATIADVLSSVAALGNALKALGKECDVGSALAATLTP